MLKFGVKFEDLYSPTGLHNLYNKFLEYISAENKVDNKNSEEEFIDTAKQIEHFIIELFSLHKEISVLKKNAVKAKLIYDCKRNFIQRYVKQYNLALISEDLPTLTAKLSNLINKPLTEENYAEAVLYWQSNLKYNKELEVATQYAALKLKSNCEGLFHLPTKLNYENLVNTRNYYTEKIPSYTGEKFAQRFGFDLSDKGVDLKLSVNHANYCIFCHTRGKDSCSKGLVNKEGNILTSPLKIDLTGCPLKQKISEMNYLKSLHLDIAALAVITLDNPLCIATGHRICNDCKRSCIYQNQEPVDVPGVETNILENVLSLPYGFEIYSLLTRWNPLNILQPTPKFYTKSNVLIVGLGPAGFTLAHYLLNEGYRVVAIDGLKIEPLSPDLTGRINGILAHKFKPIKFISEIFTPLSTRIINGFGGVMEYGITARWNKNYLNIIRLLLERRENFFLQGATRFGSNITFADYKRLKFQHLVMALGAGKPRLPNIRNFLIRGVRTAADFLMLLQLGGSFKKDSFTNLQLRFPVIVIGGGLTAVDTATEALAYYPQQVLRFAERYHTLVKKYGIEFVELNWKLEEKLIAQEFLTHASIIQKLDFGGPKLIEFLQQLGGVKIIYYGAFTKSPAYRLNYEELQFALNEGVEFIENMQITEFISDKYGHVEKVKLITSNQEEVFLPSKSILVATGVQDNLDALKGIERLDPLEVTIIGDLHPNYRGSVVKAMASAKNCYKNIKITPNSKSLSTKAFFSKLAKLLKARVYAIHHLTNEIIEIIIKSPLAAHNFQPGQFYKLQNFEYNAATKKNISLLSEPIAITGAKVNKKSGLISIIILCNGTSTLFCKYLCKGEIISLMGPIGTPTEIATNEKILLIGEGVGNAGLFFIGQAMRAQNCEVLYIAGYSAANKVFKRKEIEKASNITIWASELDTIIPSRLGDKAFQGTILGALQEYNLQLKQEIPLSKIDRVLVIGSHNLIRSFKLLLNNHLESTFKADVKFIISLPSPMQCMMQGMCGACLQQVEGEEGKFIYTCCNQEQLLDKIDLNNNHERLQQNSLEEKLSFAWSKYICEN